MSKKMEAFTEKVLSQDSQLFCMCEINYSVL